MSPECRRGMRAVIAALEQWVAGRPDVSVPRRELLVALDTVVPSAAADYLDAEDLARKRVVLEAGG